MVWRNAGKLVMVLYAAVVACGTPHPVPSPHPPNPSPAAPPPAPGKGAAPAPAPAQPSPAPAPAPKDPSTLKDENGSYHYQSGPIAAR